jgi:hypothetical protein
MRIETLVLAVTLLGACTQTVRARRSRSSPSSAKQLAIDSALGIANVHVRIGDGYANWPEAARDRAVRRGKTSDACASYR